MTQHDSRRTRGFSTGVLKVVLTVLSVAAYGQDAASLKFDVASIKPNKSDSAQIRTTIMNPLHSGRFHASQVTLKTLVQVAYGVQESQVAGGPAWVGSEYFDVEARSSEALDAALAKMTDDAARSAKRQMLQALIADRFALSLRRATAQGTEYALVVAKSGPKLLESKPDADAAPGAPVRTRMMMTGGQMTFQQMQMGSFAQFLSQQLHRTVVDKTGLTGRYDFTFKWVPEAGPGDRSDAAASPDSNGLSIYTALQEQLGLKVESQKGAVETLTIDHVEKPSEN